MTKTDFFVREISQTLFAIRGSNGATEKKGSSIDRWLVCSASVYSAHVPTFCVEEEDEEEEEGKNNDHFLKKGKRGWHIRHDIFDRV